MPRFVSHLGGIGPLELCDGTLRCEEHGLEFCRNCGVDYRFHEEETTRSEAQLKVKQERQRKADPNHVSPRCIGGCGRVPKLACPACKVSAFASPLEYLDLIARSTGQEVLY